MNNHDVHMAGASVIELVLLVLFAIMFTGYILAVIYTNRRFRPWPIYRSFSWVAGIISAFFAMVGPLAERAHTDFTAHMLGHLLLGMLSPLLLVLAAPMTLILRTLSVRQGRFLVRLLKSWPLRFLTDPIIAALLNMGGLWILYTTDLYLMMHDNIILYIFIHFHVFIAGYLFTASIIYIDPTPHRSSFLYRAMVLFLAIASHSILAKYIYANPPKGVPSTEAEIGGMLMYYGGDAIDIIIIFLLCLQWYKASRCQAPSVDI